MMRPDLHLHTTASDGMLDASQLARCVQRADVTLFSVTDHDTMAGLSLASDAAYDRGLAFIPGVEISTEGDDEIHILGYGVKHNDPVLLDFFSQMAQDRIERCKKMLGLLDRMGMPLSWDEIQESASGSLGRPHIARALLEKGWVQSVEEAFDRFLSQGKPAYLPRATVPASQAISLLRSRGAVPVLAHPALIKWPTQRLLPMLKAWQDAGLMGIEVYHPANKGFYSVWDKLTRQRGLLVTGGSDFHDFNSSHGQIGETVCDWSRAGEDGWALFQAVRSGAGR